MAFKKESFGRNLCNIHLNGISSKNKPTSNIFIVCKNDHAYVVVYWYDEILGRINIWGSLKKKYHFGFTDPHPI